MREHRYHVYVVASRSHTLSIRVTSALEQRIREHKDGVYEGIFKAVQVQPARASRERKQVTKAVHTELWTSWASLLRSYAAAHGLNAPQHAVVEVSADGITLRVGPQWLRFTHTAVEGSHKPPQSFHLNENGTVTLADAPEEEMDIAAERFAREIMTDG